MSPTALKAVLPGQILRNWSPTTVLSAVSTRQPKDRGILPYFVSGEVLVTDARTAEMSKLTENAFRDVNIAFANELSLICDRQGITV
jgi:UDP-N-acetyl-D-mannosaminuronic acid dehydrogenase